MKGISKCEKPLKPMSFAGSVNITRPSALEDMTAAPSAFTTMP